MTRINELDPAPNTRALAEMEMQPEHYEVISLGSGFGRDTAEDATHARAHIVIGIGRTVSREEMATLALQAIATLSAYLDRDTLRLDYRPGPGNGDTPPDTAIPDPRMWVCARCRAVNTTDTEHCTECGSWHNHEGKAI